MPRPVWVFLVFASVAATAYLCTRKPSPAPVTPSDQEPVKAEVVNKSRTISSGEDQQPFRSDAGKLDATQEAKHLGLIASAQSMDEIEAELKQRDADVQVAAIKKLLALPNSEEVVAKHYLALAQAAKAVVHAAAQQPEKMALRRQLEACAREGLHGAIATDRLEAVRSFRALAIQPPKEEFAAFLLNEPDSVVLSESINLAGADKRTELHATLLKLAEEGPSGVVRRRALENLVSTGGHSDDATLRLACKSLSDPDGEVRLGAIIALGYQGWERIPKDVREQIKTLATSDTYRPQNAATFPVQDAARMLVLSGNEKITSVSNSEHQQ